MSATHDNTQRRAAASVAWTREQIRAARHAPLLPLLLARGMVLLERSADNCELAAHPGLIVKDSYWRWPQQNKAGNAIDFFVTIEGMSFHAAMRFITQHTMPDASQSFLHANTPRTINIP